MNANRQRLNGRLEQGPRGIAIVTAAGDHRVLEDYAPRGDQTGSDVTVEGVVVGLDRLRVEWLGETDT